MVGWSGEQCEIETGGHVLCIRIRVVTVAVMSVTDRRVSWTEFFISVHHSGSLFHRSSFCSIWCWTNDRKILWYSCPLLNQSHYPFPFAIFYFTFLSYFFDRKIINQSRKVTANRKWFFNTSITVCFASTVQFLWVIIEPMSRTRRRRRTDNEPDDME